VHNSRRASMHPDMLSIIPWSTNDDDISCWASFKTPLVDPVRREKSLYCIIDGGSASVWLRSADADGRMIKLPVLV
jgi:hypothetical protein